MNWITIADIIFLITLRKKILANKNTRYQLRGYKNEY